MMKKLKIGLLLAGITAVFSLCVQNHAEAVVSNQATTTISSLGNGVTTNYTIGFQFQNSTDVQVWLQDESVSPFRKTQVLLGAGAGKYTITGTSPGTTVVMGTAPSASQRVVIKRVMPFTQTVNYIGTDAFPSSSHERQMDKSVLLLQQLNADLANKPGFSVVSSVSGVFLPDPFTSRLLGYTQGASNFTLYPPTTSSFATGDVLSFDGWNWSGTPLLTTTTAGLAAHLADHNNPHVVTSSQVGNTIPQWNANQLQSVAISAPSPTSGDLLQYNGTNWSNSNTVPSSVASLSTTVTNHINNLSNPHNVTAAQVGNGTAQWNADQLQGNPVSSSAPTNGQALTWNGSTWIPAAVTATSVDVSSATGILPSIHGGTGVNNAGSLTYGSSNVTLTTSGATNITVPTSGTVATLAGTEVLTNKTLSGNTASSLINGSGTLNINSSGTITAPNVTDTLVGKATTDAFTNKTFTDAITGNQIATPSNPASGFDKLYFKNDNNLYKLTSGGVESQVGSGGAGSISTAANIGTAGVGTFWGLNGTSELDFKKIHGASSKLSVTDNTGSSIVDLDVVEANLSLQNLGGTVQRFQIGASTANFVVINDASGKLSEEARLAPSRGGSGINNTGTFTWGSNNITAATTGTTSVTLPTAGTLATLAGTEVLTNKTLTGNTAANLISGSGTLTLNTTGAVVIPPGSETLVGKSTVDSLTNKTFADAITGAQLATPSNPSAGFDKLYFKNDNNLYKLTSGGVESQVGSGSGNISTAGNIGTAGVGVFWGLNGTNELDFKKFHAASSKVSVTDNTGSSIVDLDVVEANLNHANIGGLVQRYQVGASTANYVLINDASGKLSEEQRLATSRGGTGIDTSASTGILKDAAGTFSVSALVNADVAAGASIARNKIANDFASAFYAVVNDATGQLSGVAPGANNNVLKSNGTQWVSGAPTSAPASLTVVTKTADYTATTSDGLIQCNTNAFTVTLPAASSAGVDLRIIKIGSDVNAITVAAGGSDTINLGANTTLNTQWEQIEVVSDGVSNWNIVNRSYPESWTAYTPTFQGFGTPTSQSFFYRRVGSNVEIMGFMLAGSTTASQARLGLPLSATIDSTVAATNGKKVGQILNGNGAATNITNVFAGSGNTYLTFTNTLSGSQGDTPVNGNSILGSGDSFWINASVPISGWNGAGSGGGVNGFTGTVNNAINIGTGGVGDFWGFTGSSVLSFKNIKAGSSKITVTDNTGNSTVDIDVAQSNLDHALIGGTVQRYQIGASTANYVVINNASGRLSEEAQLAPSRGGTGIDTSASTGLLKDAAGTFSVATLVNADVASGASIARNKIANNFASAYYAVVNDNTGALSGIAPGSSGNVLISNGTQWISSTPLISEVSNGTCSGSININWQNGPGQSVLLAANCTFTFTNPASAERVQLKVVQNGTGGFTATWPTSSPKVFWPTAAPIVTSTANAIDIVTLYFDGTNYYATDTQDFR